LEDKVYALSGNSFKADCKEFAIYVQQLGIYKVSVVVPFYFKPADVQNLGICCKGIADFVT